jgi:hypothetical protein
MAGIGAKVKNCRLAPLPAVQDCIQGSFDTQKCDALSDPYTRRQKKATHRVAFELVGRVGIEPSL